MTDSIDVYIDQDPTQSQVDPQATTKERIPDPSTTRLCVDVVRKPLRTNYIYGMQVRRCDTMVGRCRSDTMKIDPTNVREKLLSCTPTLHVVAVPAAGHKIVGCMTFSAIDTI